MHIYAFGSLCRGEFDNASDVDILIIKNDQDSSISEPTQYSIYSYHKIEQLWAEGNPFAWHLATEAKILFTSNEIDYLTTLGKPNSYKKMATDCKRFQQLLIRAKTSLDSGSSSPVFELSTIFLAIRNFATCYSLGQGLELEFSRKAAQRLGDKSVKISDSVFSILERARLLSTRGYGEMISLFEIHLVKEEMDLIQEWMNNLLKEV